MNMFSWKKLGTAAMTLFVAGMLLGCEDKGPAQKAGENLDNAGKDLKNAVNPKGPGEKVGEKVDNALGK